MPDPRQILHGSVIALLIYYTDTGRIFFVHSIGLLVMVIIIILQVISAIKLIKTLIVLICSHPQGAGGGLVFPPPYVIASNPSVVIIMWTGIHRWLDPCSSE